ncbi:uncharacterized protein LOC111366931 [Olea europaea var. sylvestris]|uniref:uncharacterized protein LOC111366931 n=1 Tax=Olea europaea var. sylvestris TaxID=158386 RepID=UPI000C1D5EBA|nr:uncharacterized protein LOC111366931 [Olea europaea var. sylvestris]
MEELAEGQVTMGTEGLTAIGTEEVTEGSMVIRGEAGQMGYVDSLWPSVAAFHSFLNDTIGIEERERIPVVEGVPVQEIPEDVGVPEEERVPEVEVVPEMTSPEAEGIPEEVGVSLQGIPEDVEGVPEEKRVPEVEVEVVPVQGMPRGHRRSRGYQRWRWYPRRR